MQGARRGGRAILGYASPLARVAVRKVAATMAKLVGATRRDHDVDRPSNLKQNSLFSAHDPSSPIKHVTSEHDGIKPAETHNDVPRLAHVKLAQNALSKATPCRLREREWIGNMRIRYQKNVRWGWC